MILPDQKSDFDHRGAWYIVNPTTDINGPGNRTIDCTDDFNGSIHQRCSSVEECNQFVCKMKI